ncbi:MAG: CapA family protein [Bdellovibrio sp.]|nr:CapA family protein [Bdellovibrio sp.]
MRLIYAITAASFLFSCQSTHHADDLARKPQTAPKAVFATEPMIKAGQEITLAFVGDVILHERLRNREEKHNEGYQTIWSNIQTYLDQADTTYANLEGPVAPEYGGVTGFPMFNYPEEIIPALKENGFDIVSTANNHALDRQAKGIKKTIENLNKYNLAHTGTVISATNIEQGTETWWALTPVAGTSKSVAWLACTEMTNGNPDKENQVLYCFKDREKIKTFIQKLKSRSDIAAIILTPHWGEEEKFEIEPHVKTWGRMMLDEGASAIVGSHPHVVRKIEEYTTKDQRRTLVAYSLGNFVSNQPWTPNKLAMLLYLKFKDNQDQKPYELKDIKYIGLWTTRTIEKDTTAKYRINAVWDAKKLPVEAEKILKEQLGNDLRIKSEAETKKFLNK